MIDSATVIAENRRLRELVRAEVVLTAAAYGLPVATTQPVEAPPAEWQEARAREGKKWGRGLWKFFSPAE